MWNGRRGERIEALAFFLGSSCAALFANGCGGTSGAGALGPREDAGPDVATFVASGSEDGSARDTGAAVDATTAIDATTPLDASGSSDASGAIDSTLPMVCVPGISVACTGPGGCATNQVCNAGGTGFGACVCAPVDASATACIPGQSIACVGTGGCTTNQVCNQDGTGYGPCACTADAAPPPVCIPGASIGCVGPGGCVSNQVCNADGTGYGSCACASDGGTTLACVPGQSIACAGPNGCTSFQVCASDGSGYAACECPDAGDAGDASATWTPAQLPGLALWFNDTGIVQDVAHPGFVVHWLDSSGNGNEGSLGDGYNGGSIFQGAEIDPEVLNGHDAVECGSTIGVAQSPTLSWGSGDFAIITVAVRSGSGLWTGNGVTLSTSNEACTLSVPSQSIDVSTAWATGFEIIAARGQSLYLNVAGQITAGGTNTTALTAGGVTLCSGGGEIAEVIAVQGTLSDPDLASTLQYLQTKFRL
jgi:hypothetical protein